MKAIIYKNILYFKHNISELLTQILNFLIEIIPLIFMIYIPINTNNLENYIVIFSYLLGCLIVNVTIGACYEYYKEILYKHSYDLKLTRISNFKFLYSQIIFYFLLNIWTIILSLICLFFIKPFNLNSQISFLNVLFIILYLLVFSICLVSISCILAIVIKKTGVFSLGSLFCNFMLIFSTCYISLDNIPKYLHFLIYINPFYYFIDGIRTNIFFTNTVSSIEQIINLIIISSFSLILFLCLYIFKIRKEKMKN